MKKVLFIFLILISIISCENEDDFVTPTTPPDSGQQPTPDPEPVVIVSDEEFAQTNFGNMVTANFMGRIVDENGLGLEDVNISIGNSVTTTNYLGVFAINDASIFDKFAYVKAEKEGYILGSRTIVPTPNATNDIQITLLTKNVVGSVNSGETASISLQNGAEVTFSGEFTTETGTSYTGQVDVVMHYLQPNNPDTFEQMPGSLFGKREDGSAVGMETYGMLGINLFSPSGESLNISENAPVTLTFPVDASTPNAPTQMPLWYFDEAQGYWKEEGIATKVGNEYIAEVTHFSWWNCDLPISNLVTLCFTLDATVTLSNQKFEIIRTNTNQIIYSGYTNAVGQECGLFPKDENLTINIYSDCSYTIIATQQVGPFATDDSFVINISDLPSELVQTTITGTLNDCDGNPITNGYVLIYKENDINFLNVETTPIADGSLSHTMVYCSGDIYEMIVFDLANNEESDPINLNLTATTTEVGTISTCEVSGGTFVGDVSLNSQAEVDNFGLFGYTSIVGNLTINDSEGEITSLQSLTSLTTITGNLVIQNNEVLTSLAGLENLITVSGYIRMKDNALLASLAGLQNLTTISGSLEINGCTSLQNLSGMTNLTTISNSLRIIRNQLLTDLTGLENVSISGACFITYNNTLTSLTGLDNVINIGSLKIEKNPLLISLTGLENLTTISGYLEIKDNIALPNLTGLNNLTTVSFEGGILTGSVFIDSNESLINLTGLESLTTIENDLEIFSNNSLTSLTGLENLTTIDGSIDIGNFNDPNSSLSNFCALTNLYTNGNYGVNATLIQGNAYNPTVQDIIDGNCSD